MIFIDIGNTNLVFAVSSNKKIKNIIRVDSNQDINKLKKIFSTIIKNSSKIKNMDNS